jgi:uncharacterized membrane protein
MAAPHRVLRRNALYVWPVGDDVPDSSFQRRDLPPHIEEAIRSIARLNTEHHEGTTPLQRRLRGLTAIVGRPWFVAVVTALAIGWIALNLLAPSLGFRPPDPPPFLGLGHAVGFSSLYIVILIYATQRHDDQLARLREQLTLELALLSEQKAAKTIQLLEEFRHDIPSVHNRVDDQADAMAEPVDPQRVIDAIKETEGEIEHIGADERR